MTSPARRAMAASILQGCSCSFTLSPFFFNSRASRSISKMPNRKPCGDCDVLNTSNSTLSGGAASLVGGSLRVTTCLVMHLRDYPQRSSAGLMSLVRGSNMHSERKRTLSKEKYLEREVKNGHLEKYCWQEFYTRCIRTLCYEGTDPQSGVRCRDAR